jgi:ribonucleoside-diphosphate reductase alpha chain
MSHPELQPFLLPTATHLNEETDWSPGEPREHFANVLSEFVYTRTYSRWVEEAGRRETWPETVDRYVNFLAAERKIPTPVVEAIRKAVRRMDVLPSMRALWSAGDAMRLDNTCGYNCSFVPLDSLPSFAELLYVLMMGTGVGFSVERQFTGNLPVVALLTGRVVPHVIPDSTPGWADAFLFGLNQWFRGNRVDFDYSGIRPEGAPLKTKGGRASGPDPLRRLLEFTEQTILAASGRQLRPIECHDIACMVGEIVMAGGVRRAALISFSDPDDEEMRHAKDWSRGEFPKLRYMANNSAYWDHKPNEETFWREWLALKNSGSGERGFYRVPPAKRNARRSDCRSNPCGEIQLRYSVSVNPWTGEGGGGQFCNLSAAVMRADDTLASFAAKVHVAAWIGVIQSTFTHFPYLRPAWARLCDEDRLLGVDITGQCDAPHLSQNPEAMAYFNQVAVETAAEASAYMGINFPAAITCGKPSGNSSQLVDCASGFHARYSRYYIRRVRIARTDPLFRLIREQGVPVHKDNQFADWADDQCPTWVAEFPVKAPAEAVFRDAETAVQMLERYLLVMRTWCSNRGHNQSVTVYVKDHEWDEVGQWVFEHFDEITGISFLPYDGGKYKLAPYEEIDETTYKAWLGWFPTVDFTVLSQYEREDRGEGAQEYACVGGVCTIDYDALAMEAGRVEPLVATPIHTGWDVLNPVENEAK